MKFEVGKYYKTTHKRDGTRRPAICTIKTIKFLDKSYRFGNLWNVKIIRTSNKSGYKKGSVIHWYEDWCFNTKELEDYEVLTLEL